MTQFIAIVGILTAFITTTVISTSCVDEVAIFSEAKRGEDYSWLDRGGNGTAGCLVFDEKLWVFGRMDQRGTLNDVWFSRDGVHWQQAAARAPWTPRAAEHSVVFDNKLWIYGGKTGGANDGFSSDAWYMVSVK